MYRYDRLISKVTVSNRDQFSGQKLEDSHTEAALNVDPNAPWHERMLMKHRRWISIAIPYTFYNTIWWCLAIKHNFFQYFPTHYPMSLTMLVGSAIGGATSEGGGAVAFPVMTLVLKLAPAIARDFSLMVQSCGRTCFLLPYLAPTLVCR